MTDAPSHHVRSDAKAPSHLYLEDFAFGQVYGRVLGQHRYEIADPMIASEAGEQGDADIHHPLGLRDHDRAPPEARQPMPLAGVVPLDAMRLILARVQLSNWQEHVVDGVVVRTGEPGAPARQPLDQALASGLVTTAAFPVHQLACRTIPSLPDPERLGLFSDNATSHRARSPPLVLPARASGRRRPRTAPARPG